MRISKNPFCHPLAALLRARPGVALVLVLGSLVLILVLMIALLTRATTERISAKSYASTTSARQLSEMAVNLVQGQITAATTQGGEVTWASQPGMIRTFGTETNPLNGRSKLLLAYKLYSATDMVKDKLSFQQGDLSEDFPPQDWAKSPGIWTDLNEPSKLLVDGQSQDIYPILDPKAGTELNVEGYVTRAFEEKLPVRWLYVLKDGSMKAGTLSGTTVNVAGATAGNPIVGRIAFWADDETSKINLNTAGIGKAEDLNTTTPTLNGAEPELYWDVPRFMTLFDKNLLANAQPAKNEFTRYPGHPAWTSLSTVFPTLSMSDTLSYGLLPRYEWGGTRGGSRRADKAITLSTPPKRLFATVDEFIFNPDRSDTGFKPNELQKLRFFLTTNSRAPEINLFNMPRIACWPIADASLGETYRTAYDQLIAFASSAKGRAGGSDPAEPYYFQRKNAYSTTEDFAIQRNLDLYSYLQQMTQRPVPGFGGTFSTKFTVPERDQILTSIVDYVRCTNLFDDNLDTGKQFTRGNKVPNSAFDQPAGHAQVMPLRHPSNGTQGFGRFYSLSELAIQFICNADGSGEFKNPPPAAPSATNPPKTFTNAVDQINNNAKIMSNIATGINANRTLNGTKLNFNEKRIEAMIHLELFSPSLGNRPMASDLQFRVKGLEAFKINGAAMGFPAVGLVKSRILGTSMWIGKAEGACPGIRYLLMPNSITDANALKRAPQRGFLAADAGAKINTGSADYNLYPLLSIPMTITTSATDPKTMVFTGGTVTVEIFGNADTAPTTTNLIQTITIDVPGGTFPTPNIVSLGTINSTPTLPGYATNPAYWWTFSRDGATSPASSTVRNHTQSQGRISTFNPVSWSFNYNTPFAPKLLFGPSVPAATVPLGAALFRGGTEYKWDNSVTACPVQSLAVLLSATGPTVTFTAKPAIPQTFPAPFDVVRSLLPKHGDYRLIAGRKDVPASVFVKHPDWDDATKMFACNLYDNAPLERLPTFPTDNSTPLGSATLKTAPGIGYVEGVNYGPSPGGGVMAPDIISTYLGSSAPQQEKPGFTGDFDNGLVAFQDGPYINKPDEGNASYELVGYGREVIPYFSDLGYSAPQGSVLFSPNRIMPSPGMFGSISTGIQRDKPWQTLLFRPQPSHPNSVSPPDHLLLDLFWMPTVEPYAISDPFATAGKVNMNSQLMPFTWIERTTALRAVFKSERMIVVPNSQAENYKSPVVSSWGDPKPGTSKSYRLPLEVDTTTSPVKDDTMQNFHLRFNQGDIFRSATEICDLWMVPKGSKLSEMTTYWNDKRLTGDESRERIYTTLLPRLTTKSNTFTVHVRAQALQKSSTSPPGAWVEGVDLVRGEYRGSTIIERYLDPNEESIPDYATNASAALADPLDRYYKWRQLQTVDFNY